MLPEDLEKLDSLAQSNPRLWWHVRECGQLIQLAEHKLRAAEAERDALRATEMRKEEFINALTTRIHGADGLNNEVRTLQAQNRELREALEKYGAHESECIYFLYEESGCDCGLAALKAKP